MLDSILGKLTIKPLLIAVGVLLLALAVLTTLYIGRGSTIDSQAETIATQKRALEQAASAIKAADDANAAAMATVTDLNRRLTEAIGQNQRTEEANAAALAQLDKARRDRDRYRAEAQRLKEATYATDPTCNEWGARPVCPAISDQLRDQWARAAGGRGEAGSVGGAGAAAGGPGPEAAGSGPAPAGARPGFALSRILGAGPPLLLEPAAGSHADHRAR